MARLQHESWLEEEVCAWKVNAAPAKVGVLQVKVAGLNIQDSVTVWGARWDPVRSRGAFATETLTLGGSYGNRRIKTGGKCAGREQITTEMLHRRQGGRDKRRNAVWSWSF